MCDNNLRTTSGRKSLIRAAAAAEVWVNEPQEANKIQRKTKLLYKHSHTPKTGPSAKFLAVLHLLLHYCYKKRDDVLSARFN